MEDQVQSFLFAQQSCVGLGDEITRNRFGYYFVAIDPATVIGDFDYDLVPLVVGLEAHRSLSRLAGADTLGRRLNAMIHTVADEMGQRFGEHIEDALIEIGVLSGANQGDFLAARLALVAN